MSVEIVNSLEGMPPVEDHTKCMRCGRALKNPKWRRIERGPVCDEKQRYEEAMRGK